MAVLNSTVLLLFHVVCKHRGCSTAFCCVTVLKNLTSQPTSLRALEHCEQNGHLYRKIQVFWHMTVCRVSGSRRVGNHCPNDTVSYPRRYEYSKTQLCKSQITHQACNVTRHTEVLWRPPYEDSATTVYSKKPLDKHTTWNYLQYYYLLNLTQQLHWYFWWTTWISSVQVLVTAVGYRTSRRIVNVGVNTSMITLL